VIQVQHGAWKRYRVVHTNRRGRWSAKVVATYGKGTYYRTMVPATKHEVKTIAQVFRFYKVRASRSGLSLR
jgi:hypothetical protein